MKLLIHFVALLFYTSTIHSSDSKTILSLLGDFEKVNHKLKYRVEPVKHEKKLSIDDDKLHKHIKKLILKPHKESPNELIHSGESNEITPMVQVVLQQPNHIPLDTLIKKNGQFYKKSSKEFILSQPNANKAVAVKLQYRNKYKNSHEQDVIDAQDKAKIYLKVKKIHEDTLDDHELRSTDADFDIEKNRFKTDNEFNILKKVGRRKGTEESHTDSDDASSELELGEWKEQFKELHRKKKLQAINETRPPGDVVNMVAARPWGVPCGDSNQHDLPWGSCMMAPECEPAYRIYRGDHLCGRTQFVCCAIQLNNYDMYQGFDLSFDSKSLSTDTREKRIQEKDSKDTSKKKKERERKKKRRQREKRKRQIRKRIKKIVKEVQKILDKQYKNGTKQRKKKTKMLKNYIQKMKKQYKKDRESVKDIHEETMIMVDANLMKKLNDLMAVNKNFIRNETFRGIVVNHTLTKQSARMLVEAYPDMTEYIPKILRRFNSDDNFGEYLEYDIEYGYLYY